MPNTLQHSPSLEGLRVARTLIKGDDALQGLFRQAHEEERDVEWLADNLAVRLSARQGGEDFAEAMLVARSLADEFFANKDKPLSIVDVATGRVLGRYSEEDVYQPAMVPRESGNMAVPLPRLRPELEAALVLGEHDRAREQVGLVQIQAKAHQTELLKAEGDARLDYATQAGRQRILDAIPELLRARLLEDSLSLTLFRQLSLTQIASIVSVREIDAVAEEVTDEALLEFSLKDLATYNLKSSFSEAVLNSILGTMARNLGRRYMERAVLKGTIASTLEALASRPCLPRIVPAEICVALKRIGLTRLVPVPAWGPIVEVSEPSVKIVPSFKTMQIQQVEFHDRWVIRVQLPLSLYWDATDTFVGLEIPRPDVGATPAEIV